MNADQEFMDGYKDGRDLDCPEPNENRSERYKHSFNVGRAEKLGRPIPAQISRANSEKTDEAELRRYA